MPLPQLMSAASCLINGSWRQISAKPPAFSARDFRIAGGSFLRATSGGAETDLRDHRRLWTAGHRQQQLSARPGYKLVNDIDASGTVHWNGGKGFKPIGSGGYYNEFTGSLDGQNFVVSGLHINRATHSMSACSDTSAIAARSATSASSTPTSVDIQAQGGHRLVGILAGIPCCGRHDFKRLHHRHRHRCHAAPGLGAAHRRAGRMEHGHHQEQLLKRQR